jgi:alpha-L-rhamnosidase
MLFVAVLLFAAQANGAVVLNNLQVEYRATPLGIDVAKPRFSWQMAATAEERGISQSAYQIEVRDSKGTLVWDTKRTDGSASLGLKYAGSPLKAATRYSWNANVWTQAGTKLTATSWFETGLMDPSPDSVAWGGAKWIGGGNEDLVLYAPYLAIFDLHYAVTIPQGSSRASFVYGANDSRLMDKYKNIYQVESAKDQSYIKLELDISGVDGTPAGKAKLHVYRAGYKEPDDPSKPLRTFDVSTDLINAGNKNAEHSVDFQCTFGKIALSIDGNTSFTGAPEPPAQRPATFPGRGDGPNTINLNPVGSGGDYLPFGLLCDIGFSVDAGQTAMFRDVTVRNNRAPKNILFREDLTGASYKGIYADALKVSGLSIADGHYVLTGGAKGVFVVKDPSRNSIPMLRTTFKAEAKPIESARLYVTARGIYEAFLNGKRVGNDHYNPGLTQYNVTHLYQTYDVTSMVKAGGNALGAMLGEGWWSGLLSFGTVWNHFGDRQSLLANLVITYKDGTSETVATNDRTWKYFGAGPVIYSSLDFGEVYDATKEHAVEGWATAAYNDSQWKKAVVVPLQGTAFIGPDIGFLGRPGTPLDYDKLSLVGQIGNSASVLQTLTAKSVKEVRPGVFVYDMGQNMVGVPRIQLSEGAAGKVTLRYAEILYPDLKQSGKNTGMIMTENYRAAMSQDVFAVKAGPQVIQPRFTSHGYQYIEITGIDKALPLSSVEGLVISSVQELAADYKTSNDKVNRLWSNLVWSNIDNFLTIPTDCPQRNERMGWSGDISVFSRTSTYVSNADQFLTRHMYAMRDVQAPSGRFTDVAPLGGGFGGVLWGSAGIVVPWETYLQYNDVDLLEQHYPAMAAYVAYLDTTVDPKTGLTSDGVLGDWLGPQNNVLGTAFLATAYQAYDLGIMAKVAEALGKSADAAKYRAQYEKRKAFFNTTFVNPERKTLAVVGRGDFGGFGDPSKPAPPPEFRVADTQTSYAVGLGMNLFNSETVRSMAAELAETVSRENKDDDGKLRPKYSLMTGFIGTSWISQALSDNGYSEQAYRLLENNRYPSWLYSVDQGATSIWERLNGYTVENGFGGNNSMNSFNHYSFGAVGQWMIAYSLGIQRDEPGFRRFILQPEPDPTGSITWAEGHYDSMYGTIHSAWKVDGRVLTYRATVPANTVATLRLPTSDAASVKEGGKLAAKATGVEFLRYEGGRAIYKLDSGTYEFVVTR